MKESDCTITWTSQLPLGLKRARDFCDVTAPRYLHLSPVCGPTSPLQELNMRTEEQREKL